MHPPDSDTNGQSAAPLIRRLVGQGMSLGKQLWPVVGAREKDVLSLGDGLTKAVLRLDSLQQSLLELVEIITGQAVRECAEAFRKEMAQMATEFLSEKDDTILSDFDQVISHAANLERALQGFARIVQTLRVLGISTRIESARLGQQGQEFTALSDAVERLVDRVDADAKAVRSKAVELSKLCEQAKRDCQSALIKSHQDKEQASALLSSNFTTLTKSMEESGLLADNLAHTMTDIGSDISEVVTSLQFHDIVRQQIEHVAETLQELDKDDDNSIGPYEELSWIHEVCTLLTSQMRYAEDSLVTAGRQSCERIDSVVERLAELRSNMDDFLHDGQSTEALSAVVDGVDKVVAALDSTTANNERIAQASQEVFVHIQDIGHLVEDIEGVGEEIELIALNASIKSARAGEVGAALGVLALAIQDLSKNARHQSIGINDILLQASEIAKRLDDQSVGGAKNAGLERTVQALKEGVGPLTTARARLTADISSALEQAGSIGHDLSRLGRSIVYPKELAQQFSKANQEIERIGAESLAALPEDFVAQPSPRLQELFARYTMESERLVHASGAGDQAALGADDLWGLPSSDSGSELGDNIDLF